MSRRWPDKLIVGLTGNIATGKSAIMKMAAERAALTLDADLLVHDILESDSEAQKAIIAAFGPKVIKNEGGVNRNVIAEIVFKDPVALIRLESIIHPRVRQRLWQRIESSQETIIFIEAIKLIEGGLAAECDQIWVTHCPVETQIERLMNYRHMDRETAKMRVNAQAPQELKVAKADVLIDTSGSIENTREQFSQAWNSLAKLLAMPDTPAPLPSADVAAPPVAEAKKEPAMKEAVVKEAVAKEVVAKDHPAAKVVSTKEKSSPSIQSGPSLQSGATDEGLIVRRARPTDIPAILLLIRRATDGTTQLSRGEMLVALGDRGYLIGQEGTEIRVIVGWHAENLVATIDEFFVYPSNAAERIGKAVLQEVEKTANELACEVIIAFPLTEGPDEIRLLYDGLDFTHVDPQTLPKAWIEAVEESRPAKSEVMCKQLRDTRGIDVKTLSDDKMPRDIG